jgi:hypothetical protein
MRICSKCHEQKALDQFEKRKKNVYRSECKACRSKYRKARYSQGLIRSYYKKKLLPHQFVDIDDKTCFCEVVSKTHGVHKVFIDIEDKCLFDGFRISINTDKSGVLRAQTTIMVDGKRKWIPVHKLIYPHNPFFIDHKDRNPLNNCRNNLRVCTHAENMRNKGNRNINKTSRYKGVYKPKDYKKWVAYICCDGKIYRIGAFEKEEDAAEAYNKRALELHGEFAFLNKIFR